MQRRHCFLFPLLYRKGSDIFCLWHGKICGNAEQRFIAQGFKQGFNQYFVAVWRLNKYLGSALPVYFILHAMNSPSAVGGLYGKIPVKPEGLTVEPACHQPQQYTRGADQGFNPGA